ncbi:hypothetical protein N7509_011756 [Penicillium cosmopolitanum]|uniref:Uncharacterized protein n=1 Tax=Penicillium cosmopolitanum TaxID=1131564 RepID=A0A9W9SHD0_9EURO|nr:uncharacterized protein N7509_011756 [Penicillium cosmopolitanum]KAJ5378637.1 hypothetical protein N7509_011756 [Penicillium cosmopolitanum]
MAVSPRGSLLSLDRPASWAILTLVGYRAEVQGDLHRIWTKDHQVQICAPMKDPPFVLCSTVSTVTPPGPSGVPAATAPSLSRFARLPQSLSRAGRVHRKG